MGNPSNKHPVYIVVHPEDARTMGIIIEADLIYKNRDMSDFPTTFGFKSGAIIDTPILVVLPYPEAEARERMLRLAKGNLNP